MPHALFLGSSLAAQDRISLAPSPPPELPATVVRQNLGAKIIGFFAPFFRVTRAERVAASKDYRSKYGERENNSLSFIRQHLTHGTVDIVTSLLSLAVPINSALVRPAPLPSVLLLIEL